MQIAQGDEGNAPNLSVSPGPIMFFTVRAHSFFVRAHSFFGDGRRDTLDPGLVR